AHAGEADLGLGVVAATHDLEDHALTPLAVDDVVAYDQAQPVGPRPARGSRRPLTHRRIDDLVASGPDAARALLTSTLDHCREVLGDLLQEAAGWVVLRRPEQHAGPRVREVEPLAAPRDADEPEATLPPRLARF